MIHLSCAYLKEIFELQDCIKIDDQNYKSKCGKLAIYLDIYYLFINSKSW